MAQGRADSIDHGVERVQHGRAGATHRRTDGDQRDVGLQNGRRGVGDCTQAACLDAGGDSLVETLLDHRRKTAIDHVDLGGIDVDANDVVTELGETRGRNRSDIAHTEYGNTHAKSPHLPARGRVGGIERRFS